MGFDFSDLIFDFTNKGIHDRHGVTAVMEKLLKPHLRRYIHIIGGLVSLDNQIHGKRSKSRSKQRWLHSLDGDLRSLNRIKPTLERSVESNLDESTSLPKGIKVKKLKRRQSLSAKSFLIFT